MYKKDFEKLSKIPNYCLFYGNEFYLQEYEESLSLKFKNENILKLYYDEYDYETAKIHLSESSLFGGKSVLILKHNKIPSGIEKLIKYAKESYLFFFYYGNKKIDCFKQNFVRFFEPDLREIMEYINRYSEKFNITLSQEAKNYLAKSLQPSFIKKELEKLSNYSQELNLSDVKTLVFEYKEESFEDLFLTLLNGKEFYDKLLMFLETNDYRRFIPALIRYVRDLYTYNLYIKKTGASSLEGLLGYKLPYQINKQRVEMAVKFKEKDYYELLKYLLEKELEMRKGDKNKQAIFWEVISYLKLFKSF